MDEPYSSASSFAPPTMVNSETPQPYTPSTASFRNLPLDVVRMILTWLHHSLEPWCHRRKGFPLKYLKLVSKDWKYMVRNTPSLWTTIRVAAPQWYMHWRRRVERCLSRSGNLPLTITIEKGYSPIIVPILSAHRSRWQELNFLSSWRAPELADPRPFLVMPIPTLRTLSFDGKVHGDEYPAVSVDAPALRSLICKYQGVTLRDTSNPQIKSLSLQWKRPVNQPVLSLRDVLHFRNTLQVLRIGAENDDDWMNTPSGSEEYPARLPSLLNLTFNQWGSISHQFLQGIALPSLESLEILNGGLVPFEGVIPTFHNIHTLIWDERSGTMNIQKLRHLLEAFPNLRNLSLLDQSMDRRVTSVCATTPPTALFEIIFAQVHDGGFRFCPLLRTAACHHAMLHELESLVVVRPLVQKVELAAVYEGDFLLQDEVLVVRPGKAKRLEKLEGELQLVLPVRSSSSSYVEDVLPSSDA